VSVWKGREPADPSPTQLIMRALLLLTLLCGLWAANLSESSNGDSVSRADFFSSAPNLRRHNSPMTRSSSYYNLSKNQNSLELNTSEFLTSRLSSESIVRVKFSYSRLAEVMSSEQECRNSAFASTSDTDNLIESVSNIPTINVEMVSPEESSGLTVSRVNVFSPDYDLCNLFNRRLINYRREYQPARPLWRRTGDKCDEDQFLVGRTLGAGAHGVVYQGLHIESRTQVAMKFIAPYPKCNSRQYAYVRMEECLQDRLRHHSTVVKHYCTFVSRRSHPGYVVLVMEYVGDGRELWELINDRTFDPSTGLYIPTTDFDEPFVAIIASQLIAVLWNMHKMNVYFRDVKPENVLVDAVTGLVKILDFGLSCDPTRPVPILRKLLVGTPYYFPPEYFTQLKPSYITAEADWFALGILLYEIAFRDGPYPNDREYSIEEYAEFIVKGFRCVPNEDGRWTSLCDLVNRLCDPDPKMRLGARKGSATEFVEHPFLVDVNMSELISEAEHLAFKHG